jgi:hypothetical protein
MISTAPGRYRNLLQTLRLDPLEAQAAMKEPPQGAAGKWEEIE